MNISVAIDDNTISWWRLLGMHLFECICCQVKAIKMEIKIKIHIGKKQTLQQIKEGKPRL